MEWYEVVPEWMSAIGTIGAVLVALFHRGLVDRINRPKIKISCPNNNKCRVECSSNTENQTTGRELKVRVKITNKGNNVASHAAMYVDSFHKKRTSNEEFITEEFPPIVIKDFRNTKTMYVVPNLDYYYDILSIHQYDEKREEGENGDSKQFYKLYLVGEGNIIELGKGTFIIPLKFYASQNTVEMAYLKVYWNCDDFDISKEFFGVEILSQNEFNKLKIVE